MIPLMNTPEYDLTLSNNVKVRFRPFLVKEEKILLMAIENNVETEMINALIQIVQACMVTKEVDVTKLPVWDFEWLWLNIRSKSIGEQIDLQLKCPDDESQVVDYSFNIEQVKPDLNKKVETNIKFSDTYGVVMRTPTVLEVANKKTILDLTVNLMKECISQIYNGEEIFEVKDVEPEELDQFIDNLTMPQYEKIRGYFEQLPVISHTIKYKNPKSGVEHEMLLQGASDFFQLPSYTRA